MKERFKMERYKLLKETDWELEDWGTRTGMKKSIVSTARSNRPSKEL